MHWGVKASLKQKKTHTTRQFLLFPVKLVCIWNGGKGLSPGDLKDSDKTHDSINYCHIV